MTKGKLYSEIEEERRRRLELEKRLAESNQREEEFTHENRRLEKSWNDVKSQLDTVQAEVRSSKYSLSEQASRIKELERKLKNEKEKYEELERERDTMKDEYDQDLEEQKDINRHLEQMVMSKEFEKELEDEINQVKELEHANRRFKVKIEMLKREKCTIAKKCDIKIDEYTNKITSLEEQLTESDTRAGNIEEKA
jgi:chromosome segregation ATPase